MGRSSGKKLKNKTVSRPKNIEGERLRHMAAKFDGKDKITGKKIKVGDEIFYNPNLKEAYHNDNLFATAGSGGAIIQEIFMSGKAKDPVGLLGVLLLLKDRGVPVQDIEKDPEIIISELNRWSMFIGPEKTGSLPTPSVLMLIDTLGGREDLRAKLESERTEPFESEDDYKSSDPELDAALKKMLDDLKNIGDPRDTYSRGARSWWTDFGAVSIYSNPGMSIRRALREFDLAAFRRKIVASKIINQAD